MKWAMNGAMTDDPIIGGTPTDNLPALEQIGPRFRELYIFPLAVEELDAPVFFQGLDSLADRWLADMQ